MKTEHVRWFLTVQSQDFRRFAHCEREQSDVVVVTTREPGGQHETQYFYDFIVAPHANAV